MTILKAGMLQGYRIKNLDSFEYDSNEGLGALVRWMYLEPSGVFTFFGYNESLTSLVIQFAHPDDIVKFKLTFDIEETINKVDDNEIKFTYSHEILDQYFYGYSLDAKKVDSFIERTGIPVTPFCSFVTLRSQKHFADGLGAVVKLQQGNLRSLQSKVNELERQLLEDI